MRISDWSSDVCSSDLLVPDDVVDLADELGGASTAGSSVWLMIAAICRFDQTLDLTTRAELVSFARERGLLEDGGVERAAMTLWRAVTTSGRSAADQLGDPARRQVTPRPRQARGEPRSKDN